MPQVEVDGLRIDYDVQGDGNVDTVRAGLWA